MVESLPSPKVRFSPLSTTPIRTDTLFVRSRRWFYALPPTCNSALVHLSSKDFNVEYGWACDL